VPRPRIHGRFFEPVWPQVLPPEFVPADGTVTPASQATATTILTGYDTGSVLVTDQASGTVQPANHDSGTAGPTGQAKGGVTPT
jgi:hypothetical protein